MSSETLKPFINPNSCESKRKLNLPFLVLSLFVVILSVLISFVVVSEEFPKKNYKIFDEIIIQISGSKYF